MVITLIVCFFVSSREVPEPYKALYLGAQGAAADTIKILNSKSRVLYRLGQVSFEKLTVRFGYFP